MKYDKCIIFGPTPFGKMLAQYLKRYTDYKIEAFVVDRAYKNADFFDAYSLVAFEEVEQIYSPEEYTIFLALGYQKMNNLRKQKYCEAKEKGYTIGSFIHPATAKDMVGEIGEGNIIFESVTLGYNVKIGNCNIVWNGCQISHECDIGDFNYFSPRTVLAGCVTVENNCFFGINSAARGGNTIKNYSLIGAGSYMNHGTEEYEVYVPARTIRLDKHQSIDMI